MTEEEKEPLLDKENSDEKDTSQGVGITMLAACVFTFAGTIISGSLGFIFNKAFLETGVVKVNDVEETSEDVLFYSLAGGAAAGALTYGYLFWPKNKKATQVEVGEDVENNLSQDIPMKSSPKIFGSQTTREISDLDSSTATKSNFLRKSF